MLNSLPILLIVLPVAAAIAILLGACAKKTALLATAVNLALTLALVFGYDQAKAGYQFTSSTLLAPQWKLSFALGVDGLSLILLLLTAIVAFAAVWVAPRPEKLERYPSLYYACLLFIVAGATGAFASLDLFFFYAFHELALIPTFLLIGIWGSGDRLTAAWKITIYLALGSFVLLVGLLALYMSLPDDVRTFSIPDLQALALQGGIPQTPWIYLTILLGFGILISLFPFHTWAPSAYASAPAPAAMLHAGVLKKFGLYGLLRVGLPLMPQAAQHWTNLLLLLLVGNILYVGLVTIAQKRLDTMLGYSSVMHMGYIFLGIAAFNPLGLTGAAMLMFAHGLSIATLFAIAGAVRERTGSLEFAKLGGLAKPMPFLGFTFGLAAFAAIGLPGFANFASELPIFFGAFAHAGKGLAFSYYQAAGIVALWGVVISAVYMLRGYRATFLGEAPKRWAALPDLSCCLRPAIILLLAVLLVGGFRPQLVLNLVAPTIKAVLPVPAQ
ncbi:MAG: NADH-quinone oxidoreductase subunit M [Chthoniobacteraceae bacterium]|nr:NADH-quinone oxidoreductase subunit M [Chthoniobacteraceae bacterium]